MYFSPEHRIGWAIGMVAIAQVAAATTVSAQPIPAGDGTATQVTPNGDRFDIEGGQRSSDGINLFHSFDRFDLNEGQTANFILDPAIQNILGRVVGGDASYINGLIQVTGGDANLFLLNPAGIVFGSHARLDVPASFTATTATGIGFEEGGWFDAFSTHSWANLVGDPNAFRFDGTNPGSIANFGELAVTPGENLSLLGGTILNDGTLSAPEGNITLAAIPGENLVRLSAGENLLSLEVSPIENPNFTPLSLPELLTGGNLDDAGSVTVQPDGTVTLTSTQIEPQVGDAIVSGEVSVRGNADNPTNIQILGSRVGLFGATLDASGDWGGGNISIGGDFGGLGTLPTAQQTVVDARTSIFADALQSGDGGRVSVWADDTTQFFGHLSARGSVPTPHTLHPTPSSGGFVEISGANALHFAGTVNLLTPGGEAGNLLLDPKNITIAPTGTIATTPDLLANNGFGESAAGDVTITGAALGAAIDGASVTLQANNDIVIDDDITATTPGNGLSLQAGRSISIEANRSIQLNGGDFSARINDENAMAGERDAGNPRFELNPNAQILTDGGNITIDLGNFGGTAIGDVRFSGSTLDAGGGNIEISGTGGVGESASAGIELTDSALVTTTGTGTIALDGMGGTGLDRHIGIRIRNNASIETEHGNISLTGVGTGTQSGNAGIQIDSGGTILSAGTGNILLDGASGPGTDSNPGILLRDSPSRIRTAEGDITLTGRSQASNLQNHGILLENGGVVESTGEGNIAFNGMGSPGTRENDGIQIRDDGSRVSSVDGDLAMTGVGFGTDDKNHGIFVFDGGVVESTGGGNVALEGIGAAGVNDNDGIRIRDDGSRVSVVDGDLTLTGVGSGTGTDNYGIFLGFDGAAEVTGTGNIELDGRGGGGSDRNDGIRIRDNARVRSTGGAIHLAGSSAGTGVENYGILLDRGGGVESTGNITLEGTGGVGLDLNSGIRIKDATTSIRSTDGDITLTGVGMGTRQDNYGILLDLGSSVEAMGTGNITFDGTSQVGRDRNAGIRIRDDARVSAVDGAIALAGSSAGMGRNNRGILLGQGGTVEATGSGSISLEGTTENSRLSQGISLNGANTRISAIDGEIRLTGTSLGLDSDNDGIRIEDGAVVESTGTGNLTLTGTGEGSFGSDGIDLRDRDSRVSSIDGDIHLTGTSLKTGSGNEGIDLLNHAAIESTGTGNLVLEGLAPDLGIDIANSSISLASGDMTLTGNAIQLTGSTRLGGSGAIAFEPADPIGIGIGDNLVDARLNLNTSELSTLQDGFREIRFGRPDGTGDITLDAAATFQDPVRIVGGSTLIGPDRDTTWTLSGVNSGTLTGYPNGLTFENIENLTGGDRNDTFVFENGASLTGIINGARGIDALDYSAYSTPVTVDLPNNLATGTRGVFNIENVTLPVPQPVSIPTPEPIPEVSEPESTPEPNPEIAAPEPIPEPIPEVSEPESTPEPNPKIAAPEPIPAAIPEVTEPELIPEAISEPNPEIAEPELIPEATPEVTEPEFVPEATPEPIGNPGPMERLPQNAPWTFDALDLHQNLPEPDRHTPVLERSFRDDIGRALDAGQTDRAVELYDRYLSEETEAHFNRTLDGEIISFESLQTRLRQMLDAGNSRAAVIYAFSRPDRLDLIFVSPEGKPIRKQVLEADRETLARISNDFRRHVTDRTRLQTTSYLDSAQTLYQWLIEPLEAELAATGVETLIFALDDGLRLLPLAALHDGDRFLVEKYSLALVPSLTLTATKATSLKNGRVLAMGASQFERLPPLPAVPVELAAIVSDIETGQISERNSHQMPGLWSGKALLNDAFTLENLQHQQQNQSFEILHLATHAQFKGGNSANSYIQFWNEPLYLDRLSILERGRSAPDLLVLSACSTAVGDVGSELGFAGVAVQSGIPSAIASLWYVSDEATLALMQGFYARLIDAPHHAEALRQAQIAILRGDIYFESGQLHDRDTQRSVPLPFSSRKQGNYTHPYFWAAFTSIGNPW